MNVAGKQVHLSIQLGALFLIAAIVGGFGAYTFLTTSNKTGLNTYSNTSISLSVTITKQGPVDFNWLAQMKAAGQDWTYSISNGVVTYFLAADPVITDEGLCLEQNFIFGASGVCSGYTSEWGVDTPTVIWLSTSSNAISATDTQAGTTGPCYNGATGVITTGGLKDAAGTVTAGTIGSTVTTTITHTFTAAETDTSVQASCLKSETDAGSHIVIYAEGTFGPDTLVSGNTLAITWTIARS